MSDPRMQQYDQTNTPFDGKRMIYGGFQPFIQV